MRRVILSADGDRMLYMVPDEAAERLEEFCMAFCGDWIWHSPEAARYRKGNCVSYTEADFVAWLNRYRFPDQPAYLVKNLGSMDEELPAQYRELPWFNF